MQILINSNALIPRNTDEIIDIIDKVANGHLSWSDSETRATIERLINAHMKRVQLTTAEDIRLNVSTLMTLF